jgi:hypothetical protein
VKQDPTVEWERRSRDAMFDELIDYWQGQARFWRRLWWATMAVAGVFCGLWLAAEMAK